MTGPCNGLHSAGSIALVKSKDWSVRIVIYWNKGIEGRLDIPGVTQGHCRQAPGKAGLYRVAKSRIAHLPRPEKRNHAGNPPGLPRMAGQSTIRSTSGFPAMTS